MRRKAVAAQQHAGAHLFLAGVAAGDADEQVEHGHGAVVDAEDDIAEVEPELAAASA